MEITRRSHRESMRLWMRNWSRPISRRWAGVPAPNIQLLQDWKAVRTDIEEFILGWLPKRLTSESVVIVYFSGQAAVSPSGET